MFRTIGKVFLAIVLAALIVICESFFAATAGGVSVIPFQAHTFVLAFILIYLCETASEIRITLEDILALQRASAARVPVQETPSTA